MDFQHDGGVEGTQCLVLVGDSARQNLGEARVAALHIARLLHVLVRRSPYRDSNGGRNKYYNNNKIIQKIV